jgi:hypothetical protein
VGPLFAIFCAILIAAQFALPRRLAFLPLLIAVCHVPNVPVVEIGITFTITKLVLLAGVLRGVVSGKPMWSPQQSLDVFMALWAGWAILSGVFHHPRDHNPITVRMSLAYDIFGAYLYARCFIRKSEDLVRFVRSLTLVMLPLAALMAFEYVHGYNPYSALGAQLSEVRDGIIRCNGPFGHSILAGTVGAACSFFIVLHRTRWVKLAGLFGCGAIVVLSHSSGPLLTYAAGLTGLVLWRWRNRLGWVKTGAIIGLIALHLVMKAPVWYLIARIDLTGSSTSYYRAELITQALNHFDTWWLTGTDYTRDWMPSGVLWSSDQADIVNYYIKMGVIGGAPLLLLFLGVFRQGYHALGRRMRLMRRERDGREFYLWCIGVTLFAYNVSFIGVTPFDQSYVFFCLALGMVPGITAPIRQSDGEIETDRVPNCDQTARVEEGAVGCPAYTT